jgi:hypothetical protein
MDTYLYLSVVVIVSREFYHRIKGVGHSAFTSEEVSFLSDHGNDVVNAKYLKNYNPALEVLKPPDASVNVVDEQFLRVWLRRKYVDKAWASKDESVTSQSNDSQESRRRTLQPTRAQIPPKIGPTPAISSPTVDLLGGFMDTAVSPSFTPSCTLKSPAVSQQPKRSQEHTLDNDDDDGWDAFGRQRESCPVPSFQTDFSFPQQSTAVHGQKGGEQAALQPSTFEADFSQFQANAHQQSPLNVTMNGDEKKVEPALNYTGSQSNSTPTNPGIMPPADPFDAFNNLHISHPVEELNHVRNSPLDMNHGFNNQAISSSHVKYEVGQKLQYRDSQHNISLVEVVKVHLDQDLVPFYDIKLENGWEKQTDNNHLSIPSQTMPSGNDMCQTGMIMESKDVLVDRICNVVRMMNEEQLLHVDRFIRDVIKVDI